MPKTLETRDLIKTFALFQMNLFYLEIEMVPELIQVQFFLDIYSNSYQFIQIRSIFPILSLD
jgi:hypothetical protein